MVLLWLLHFLIGMMFIIMGVLKLISGEKWLTKTILSYQIISRNILVTIVARVLPISEVLLGVMLVLGLFTQLSLAISYGMISTFTYLLMYSLYRGITIDDCGCFGNYYQRQVSWNTVSRNLLLLLTISILYIINTNLDNTSLIVSNMVLAIHFFALLFLSIGLSKMQKMKI